MYQLIVERHFSLSWAQGQRSLLKRRSMFDRGVVGLNHCKCGKESMLVGNEFLKLQFLVC